MTNVSAAALEQKRAANRAAGARHRYKMKMLRAFDDIREQQLQHQHYNSTNIYRPSQSVPNSNEVNMYNAFTAFVAGAGALYSNVYSYGCNPVYPPYPTITVPTTVTSSVSTNTTTIDTQNTTNSTSTTMSTDDIYAAIVAATLQSNPSKELIEAVEYAIKSQPKSTKISFAQSPTNYQLNPVHQLQIMRDRTLIDHVLHTKMPKSYTEDDWNQIANNWAVNLSSRFDIHGKCSLVFKSMLVDPELPPVKEVTNDQSSIPTDIDLDTLMEKDGSNMVLVCNEYQVLCATLSISLCSIIKSKLAGELSINTIPNSYIISGIKQNIAEDKSQQKMNRKARSLTCDNYGVSTRNSTKYVDMTGKDKTGSLDHYGSLFYYKYLYPANFDADLEKIDKRYDHVTNPTKPPRVDIRARFEDKDKLYMPRLMKATVPTYGDGINRLMASCYESLVARRLGEEILSSVFSTLPYAMCPFIGCMNEHDGLEPCDREHSRPFPRGSLGTNLTKSLHDDKNGIFALTCWQNLLEDASNQVRLSMRTKLLRWSLLASADRFSVLNGMIAHKTEVVGEQTPSQGTRLHHSSYMKIDHEHLAFVALSNGKLQTKSKKE